MFYFGVWRLFVAAAATLYQENHFWRTEGQELLHLCNQKLLYIWIHCSAWSNLMQEVQFLEFMGGSNLMHAHSNYLICIWINMVTMEQLNSS